MNALFLDFDGVCNNENTPPGRSLWCLDRDNIAHLNTLVHDSRPSIVVSSTWRFGMDVKEMRERLVEAGFQYPEYVVDHTPRRVDGPQDRAWEIHEWLRHNETATFVVLDDNPLCTAPPHPDVQYICDNLVLVDPRVGLTAGDAYRASLVLLTSRPRRNK